MGYISKQQISNKILHKFHMNANKKLDAINIDPNKLKNLTVQTTVHGFVYYSFIIIVYELSNQDSFKIQKQSPARRTMLYTVLAKTIIRYCFEL